MSVAGSSAVPVANSLTDITSSTSGGGGAASLYSDADFAFSTRLLNPNYSGALITAQRGPTSQDFGAVNGLLDLSGIVTFANGGTLLLPRWWNQNNPGSDVVSGVSGVAMPDVFSAGTTHESRTGEPAFRVASGSSIGLIRTTPSINMKNCSLFVAGRQFFPNSVLNPDPGWVSLFPSGTTFDYANGLLLTFANSSNVFGFWMNSNSLLVTGTGNTPFHIAEFHTSTSGGTITGKAYYQNSLVGTLTAPESYGDTLMNIMLGSRWENGVVVNNMSAGGEISEFIAWNTNKEDVRSDIYNDMLAFNY